MSICDKELGDVVYGARFLEGLGYVDSASIGVYGISYGGFLTLGAMAKYPGVFQMGINIAGIWDWDQYTTWRNKRYPGKPWFGAFSRLGGPKAEHNSQEWFNASPRNFVETLRGPVYNLMGSADEAVDFEQMDTLISDFVKHEKDFAALYYPGESHVFTHRATWKDAFTRMEAAFDRHLKTDPSLRPRAMI